MMPHIQKIAIDLTAVLPGGENGGAKVMTIELIKTLIQLLPETRFLLLTAAVSHEELSFFDCKNVKRKCILFNVPWASASTTMLYKVVTRVTKKIVNACMRFYARFQLRFVDLLFCPFGVSNAVRGHLPIVSVIHDLQCFFFPEFFEEKNRALRMGLVRNSCQRSTRLICISEFVKKTIVEKCSVDPHKIDVVWINALKERLPLLTLEKKTALLLHLGLPENAYLFYPANFWPHKNHKMLLAAFKEYIETFPDSLLCLVCCGSEEKYKAEFVSQVHEMHLEKRVKITPYLTNEVFAAVLQGAKAVIFPSLYEGFGIPVLEAMENGKMVLCSDTTSLPEVAGDAAIYFDPKNKKQIIEAIRRLELLQPSEISDFIKKGKLRAEFFGTLHGMAKQYITIFEKATVTYRES